MSTQRILVVDDEPKIRMTVRGYLEADGFEVLEAADGPSGLASVLRDQPDLVVLDVMLPGLDGFEVLRRIRATSQVPVILLTARTEEVDRVIGFTAGSDDYVTKPFSARELALRARAILRRAEGLNPSPEDRVLRFDGLVIDPDARTVVVDGDRTVELSALDFDLLLALAGAPGRVFTRRGLIEHVWGRDFFGDERVVDVHIRTLRRALGDDASAPRYVGTVRTVGYRFLARPVS
ncbi:response regulator transcription factor [Thermostaphylospora chromogena]|uniref:DNA-binding response regulator, OmpR family, contains REC and winged-helix (WHTH) domain n=1 Tax=Thermostaphylospora chromogena TaxID=35622 RepID=A0A1H1C8M4_9ACTN|nr:response regulator transcription factor [Thermostaphylospora chromogena]SDQ60567.1 DNA-binding response regulator, OmpR family, contains REC and winged-helix (wHTH) domain [Thermostaphylospora chromogena]